uniref:Uncharacterized protein n=1 Tax=Arundo donax TaxID=35708 RepID=A0A0A9H2J8_ARUDO
MVASASMIYTMFLFLQAISGIGVISGDSLEGSMRCLRCQILRPMAMLWSTAIMKCLSV